MKSYLLQAREVLQELRHIRDDGLLVRRVEAHVYVRRRRKGINASGRVGTREQNTDKRGLAEWNEWVAIP